MRIHRFFTDIDLSKDTAFIESKEQMRQLRTVLRLGKGDELILITKEEEEARVRITGMSDRNIEVMVVSRTKPETESDTHVHLYCAITKRDAFEWVVQKATEVGVNEITPLVSARVIKQSVKMDRLQMIAREATEQCGRVRIPVIHEPINLVDALGGLSSDTMAFIFDASGEPLNTEHFPQRSVSLFVGPEGGFEDRELEMATEAGCSIATLGPRILRTETAGVIASYLTTTE